MRNCGYIWQREYRDEPPARLNCHCAKILHAEGMALHGTYIPDLGRFAQPDPKAGDYHGISPYVYCGGDPINRVDRNGMRWTVTESKDGKQINFHITGVVINSSSKQFDLDEVAKAIENQLIAVFTFPNDDISVSMTANIRVANSAEEIDSSDHVFRIHNQSFFKRMN